MDASDVLPEDFNSQDIAKRSLTLKIHLDRVRDWDDILILFFDRMATLGHLESLRFINGHRSFHPDPFPSDEIASVTEALLCAIHSNPNLTTLDLSESSFCSDWAEISLENIFKAIEDHKGIRTVVLENHPDMNPDCSWLEKLLTRNRNITVINSSDMRISNGTTLDKLYALNRVYNGSIVLMKEVSTSLRPLLVAAALTESVSENFQHTALLLSSHTDVLNDFIDGVKSENAADPQRIVSEETVSRALDHPTQDRSKRKTEIQAPRVAKKAARNEI